MFVDSSYWVGLVDAKDQWHKPALALQPRVRGELRVLDLTVSEAVTIIGSRKGGKPARELYQFFCDSCHIIYLDDELLDSAMARHVAHDGRLSVPDCAMVEAMVREGETTIVSFDSDFDEIRGLVRLH